MAELSLGCLRWRRGRLEVNQLQRQFFLCCVGTTTESEKPDFHTLRDNLFALIDNI